MASAYDLQSLKDFVHQLAYGIEGNYDDPIAGQGSVIVIWKRFTAGFKRDHDAIPGNITLSVRNVRRSLPYVLPLSSLCYCPSTLMLQEMVALGV